MGDLTHRAIDGIRAELAAQVERTNDWRARAAQAELETSEQRTRAEAAEAELRELRRVVDAWKAAEARFIAAGITVYGDDWFPAMEAKRQATEALRHA